jgi:membrane dipeptidase
MATFYSPSREGTPLAQTFEFIDTFYQELEAFPELAVPAVTAEDVVKAKEDGRVALLLGMEGAEGLGGSLGALRMCYRLGLRVLGISWNRRNEAADGVGELRTGGGLTNFGVDVVKECNRLGILIDIAHLAPAGVDHVLEISEAPIVATHANCYDLWSHPRNLTDAQLEAVAENGGVVGVTPVPSFLGDHENEADLSELLDHVDHMIEVMGEDGVGLGLDFDGVGEMRTRDIEDVSKLPNITSGLQERGYAEDTITKILGGNFLRVFRDVL